MKDVMLQPQVVAALVGLLGVLVGVLISLATASRHVRLELQRLERTLEADYEKKLMDERLKAYQKLWKILARYAKRVLKNRFEDRQLESHLRDGLAELEQWYEFSGLTLSKDAYGHFTKLCSMLDSFAKSGRLDNEADLKTIRKRVWELRQSLRADVKLEMILPRSQKSQRYTLSDSGSRLHKSDRR